MKINKKVKNILNISTNVEKIIYSYAGLKKHLIKRNHYDVFKYFKNLEEIINSPDFVGINLNVNNISLEYVKCFDKNVLVAVKLHKSKDKFYIASMYLISDYKLNSRIKSGRLKIVDKNSK